MKQNFILIISLFLLLVANVSAQMRAYADVVVQGPVELLVTDSQGNRSGHDAIAKTYYHQIPYAFYGQGSNGAPEFGFKTILWDTLFTTTYTIQVFGTGSGTFVGDALARQTYNPAKGGQFHVVGVIDKNQTVDYRFFYSTDSTVTPTFTKVVTSRILRQDLDDCFKLESLGKEGFYKDLLNQADDIVNDIAHKDYVEAGKDLRGVQDELADVYNETFKDNPNKNRVMLGKFEKDHDKFITQDAYQILNEDVSLLLQQLPEGRGIDHEGEGRDKK
ncbi:MAG: hypothetical protein ACLP05_05700 [Candidatus Kryptoniota bacterium]